jgi:hypothetical protein
MGRLFRDLVDNIASDLGGWEHLSTLQQQLVRRAAIMSALCEREEAKAVNDDPAFNLEFLGIACDRMGRIADRLGLYRVAKNVPTLAQYLDAVAEQKASSETDVVAEQKATPDEEDEVVSIKRSGHT